MFPQFSENKKHGKCKNIYTTYIYIYTIYIYTIYIYIFMNVLKLCDVVYVLAFVFVRGCFMHGHPVNNLLLDMKTSVFQNAPAVFCSTRYIFT